MMLVKGQAPIMGALIIRIGFWVIIRIGFWGILYYSYDKQAPPKKKKKNSIGNYLGSYNPKP